MNQSKTLEALVEKLNNITTFPYATMDVPRYTLEVTKDSQYRLVSNRRMSNGSVVSSNVFDEENDARAFSYGTLHTLLTGYITAIEVYA